MKAKITFYSNGNTIKRKSYIEMELFKNSNNQLSFSVCGSYRGASGQCLDEIREFNNDPLFLEIYRLWKLYHLNDLHAGTKKQEDAIKQWMNKGNKYNYDSVCKYLKSVNLYEDNSYIYGSSWIYEEIPQNDLQIIKNIINIYNKKEG